MKKKKKQNAIEQAATNFCLYAKYENVLAILLVECFIPCKRSQCQCLEISWSGLLALVRWNIKNFWLKFHLTFVIMLIHLLTWNSFNFSFQIMIPSDPMSLCHIGLALRKNDEFSALKSVYATEHTHIWKWLNQSVKLSKKKSDNIEFNLLVWPCHFVPVGSRLVNGTVDVLHFFIEKKTNKKSFGSSI